MRGLQVLLAALLAAVIATPALAASGTALGVDQNATIATKAGTKVLEVGGDVFIGDTVATDDNGLVELRFSDKTKLVVGPRSSLVIEDYLLREDGSAGKFAVNALSGTFRFITGGAPKDRYLITTPTGTVGVRGTAFDLNVFPDHMSLLLFHGAVILCNLDEKCVTVDDTCEIGMTDFTQAQILGITNEMTGQDREAMRAMFRYAESQGDLLGAFRLEQARRCFNKPVTPVEQDPVSNSDEPEPQDDRFQKYP